MSDRERVLKASKLLNAIGTFDIATKQLVEAVEAIFHIEDLFTLAKGNSFIALNYFELICNLDYVIFTPLPASPVGSELTGVLGGAMDVIGFPAAHFPLTFKGKLAAVAYCFKVAAAKMQSLITVDIIAAFMQGTGAAQIAQDAINALLKGGGGSEITKAAGGGSGLASALPLLAGV